MEHRRPVIAAFALLTVVAALATVAVVASADTGPTPIRAALARTLRYAKREARLRSTNYTLGRCVLLHRRPWLGYRCSYTMHGLQDQCHDVLTVAVRRTANRDYAATAVKWDGSAEGAPC